MTNSNDPLADKPLPVHIPTILAAMRQLWWLPLLFVACGICAGTALALAIGKRTYRCQAIFLYTPKRVEEIAAFPYLELETHVSLIKLPANLRKISNRLGIHYKDAERMFTVTMSRKQGLLTLRAEADHPQTVYNYLKVANEVFLTTQVEKRKAYAMEYINAFQGQLDKATDRLRQSERASQEFINRYKIIDIEKEKQWYLEKVITVAMELQRAQVEQAAIELKLQKMKAIADRLEQKIKIERRQTTRGETMSVIGIRKERLLELINSAKQREIWQKQLGFYQKRLRRMEDMRQRNIVAPEDIEAVRQEISILEARLGDSQQIQKWKQELAKLDELLVPDSSKDTPSSLILKEIMLRLFNLELDQAAAADKVARYQRQKGQVDHHLQKLAELQEQSNRLQRMIEINLAAVKKYRLLIEGAELVAKLDLPDFLEVSSPQLPTRPVKSNRKLVAIAIILLFVVSGLFLAFALSCISLSVRSAGEAEARLLRPILAEFPDHSPYQNIGIIGRLLRRTSCRFAAKRQFQRTMPDPSTDSEEFRNMAVKLIPHLSGDKGWVMVIADIDPVHGALLIQTVGFGLAYHLRRMGYPTLLADFTLPPATTIDINQLGAPSKALWNDDDHREDYRTGSSLHQNAIDYLSADPTRRSLLIENRSLARLVERAKSHYCLTLLLAPLPDYKADFRLCCRLAEGGIWGMEAGARPFWEYYLPIKVMEQEHCPAIGLVVSGVRIPFCKPLANLPR